jgi:hypothetical protein
VFQDSRLLVIEASGSLCVNDAPRTHPKQRQEVYHRRERKNYSRARTFREPDPLLFMRARVSIRSARTYVR